MQADSKDHTQSLLTGDVLALIHVLHYYANGTSIMVAEQKKKISEPSDATNITTETEKNTYYDTLV